jgi:anti-anti-sigma factor
MTGGSHAAHAPPDPPEAPATRAGILIVDDRRANLVALEAVLEPLGRRVVTAESGEEALRRLFQEDFALILLDVQMPGMDGFETARLIRDRPRTRHVPIIFVTAISTAREHVFAGYAAGAVDYVLKPIDPALLRSKVSVFVELQEANARLRREAEVRATNESLSLAQRAGMSGIWDWEVGAGRLYWSPEFADLCGLPETPPALRGASAAASLPGAEWLATVDPRDRGRLAARLDALLERGDRWDAEYRILHPARGLRWIAARGRVARDAAGAAERFTGIAVDITDRKGAEARVARLHEATAALSAAASTAEVAERIVALAPGAAGARRAEVLLAPGATGARPPLEVLDGGATVVLPLAAGDGSPPLADLRLAFGRPAALDDDARAFLVGLAAQFGQALERARLFDAERRARERSQALQEAAGVLAAALDVDEVAEGAVEGVLRAFGAASAGLRLASPDGGALETRAFAGVPDRSVGPDDPSPLDAATPTALCARRGAPLLVLSGAELPAEAGGPDGGGALAAVPLRAEGRTVGVLALRLDPGARLGDDARRALHAFGGLVAQAVARAALHEAHERARERAAFLAAAGLTLDADLGVRERIEALADAVVPRLADACLIEVAGEDGRPAALAARAPSAELEGLMRTIREARPGDDGAPGTIAWVLRTGRPVLRAELGREEIAARLAGAGVPEDLAARVLADPPRSALVVPVRARGRAIGTIALASFDPARRFDDDDLRLAVDLGRRAGLAIDNARLFEAQAAVAMTLQHSLLPGDLPDVPGLELAARYVSAAAHTEAGGDWFEAVQVSDRRVVLAVGDVVGRGTDAAAVMGQLRSAMRAYTSAGLSPGAILEHLSRFARDVPGAQGSSAVCVELDPVNGRVRHARAGHPPPLLVGPDGDAAFLEAVHGTLLGMPSTRYDEGVARVPPGGAVLVFTDGAVERRGEVIDQGLERFSRVAAECWPAAPAALCEMVLLRALEPEGAIDDVALLAARREPVTEPLELLVPGVPDRLAELRIALRDWLERLPIAAAARDDVLLAAGEACSNAIEHGYGGRDPGQLTLAADWNRDGTLRVAVRDGGGWRPPAGGRRYRGRGLPIMRRIMDHVELDGRPDGTEIRMRLRPARLPRVGSLAPASAEASGPAAAPAAALKLAGTPGAPTARVSGELDSASAGDLGARLRAAAAGGAELTLDLSGTGYIDSVGTRLLWDVAETVEREGGRLVLVAPRGSPARRLLELSGLPPATSLVEAGGAFA